MSYDTSPRNENPQYATGDIVYFLTKTMPNETGARGLQIRKGTVCEAIPEVSPSNKPRLRIWKDLDEPPAEIRIKHAKDPGDLLTGEEVVSIAREQGWQENSADDAIRANHDEMAFAIGAALLYRQIDPLLGA